MKKKWWLDSVGYIIYPASFYDANNDGIGDIKGIIAKLDYLKDLGVDLVWICPLLDSPMDDNGYDVRDFYKINPLFGTNDDYKTLLKEAHKRGIKILMDFVLNHTSSEHPWFKKALEDKHSEERDMYIFMKANNDNKNIHYLPNNWMGFFSESVWEKCDDEYYFHIFSSKMPDLNYRSELTIKRIAEVVNYYLDLGVDGFRLDALAHLAKDYSFKNAKTNRKNELVLDMYRFSNLPENIEFLKDIKKRSYGNYDVLTIGEVGGGITPTGSLKYTNKDDGVIDMVFNFDTCWCNGAFFSLDKKDEEIKTDLITLKKNFARWYRLTAKKATSLPIYYDNHDHPRALSQYGSISYRKESMKMLETTLLFMYGVPFIYYGDEIGMSNVTYDDLDDFKDVQAINFLKSQPALKKEVALRYLNRTSRVNARTPMQWSDEKFAGFSATPPFQKINTNYKEVNVKNNIRDEDSVFHYVKKAIALRKQYVEAIQNDFHIYNMNNEDVFCYYHLTNDAKKLVIVSNFRSHNVPFKLPFKISKVLLNNYQILTGQNKRVTLRPFETIVYLT